MYPKILAILLLFALPIQAKTQIEVAYEAGELDLETALIYQVLSVRAPDQLPAIYRESGGLAVCGTPHLVQAMSAAPNLSAEFQARLGKLAQRRPDVQHNLLSPSGRFRVHYDTEGRHAVSPTDDDANGIPDYIDLTMAVLDSVWVLEIDQLGYNPPPSDKGLGGGDEYDAYVIELDGGYYGYAYPESNSAATTYSYLEIDNNFTDPGYKQTRGLDALRVTIAHEFHHAIQFGYYANFDGSWWQESTSTWMEEVAYPHIDDYLQYLTYFLGEPQRALNSGVYRSLHTYGSAIFSLFLDQRYGRALNRLIWEEVGRRKSVDLAHFDRVIRQVEPGGLGVAIGEFAVWNYFTGTRHRDEYYAEGNKYPFVPTRDIAITAETVARDISLVDATGSVYLRLEPQLRLGGVDLSFDADQGAWRRHLLLVGPDRVSVQLVSQPTIRISSWDQFDEIVLVATSAERTGLAYQHLFTAQFASNLTDQPTDLATLLKITSISPSRVRYNQVITIRGAAFGANRGTSRVIFHGGKEPNSSQYVSWSDTQIRVRVPAGARTGNLQIITANGSDSARLTITSPWISSISPQTGRTNTVVTINGGNFGSSRGSSTVRIGSVVVSSTSFTSWSSSRIRFRIPVNTPPGNLTVRTSEGTSNSIRLQITSPYLTRISPTRIETGNRLTLTGGNFGTRRGSGYVLFTSNVRPSAADYVSWSNSRIVVKVPARARSGNVQVTTSNGTSRTKLLQIESRSPQITSVSPRRVQYNQVVTVTGINFGSSRGSSTVRIGSVVIPSSWLDSWSNTIIRFRVPTNMRSGNVTVRTSKGTSNAILLEIISPYLGSVSPSRVKPGDRLTLTGANFRSSRGGSYVRFAPNVRPSSGDYVVWSDSRIVVKVPVGAQSGDVKVVVIGALSSGTKRIIVEDEVVESASSPQITSVSPRQVQYNQVVTVTGSNFGSSRGSSTVRIGSVAIPSSSFASWSNTRIRFRVPTNVRSGNVIVRTSAGTSNAILLEITSPYLASVSPVSVKPGDRLTLTGANFRSSRGSGYVLFAPNVRPSSGDYVTWSDSRIVVKVPIGAQSGDVKVVATGSLSSGIKRIIVEGEVVESLPSRGLFGYSPPAVTKNPKSVKFGFDDKTNSSIACYFSAKEISDGEVTIFLNEWSYSWIPESEDWTHWYLVLDRADLRSGTNIIEFRNLFNQNRTSSFARWQLKDVWVAEPPPSAKLVAGTQLLSKLPDGLVSGLGDPFPTPFNAEVTIPFVLAEAGHVRLVVYNLMGQQVRVLAEGWVAAGAHSMRWDGRTDAGAEAASGVYWAVLHSGDAVQTAKLALIR